MYGMGGGSPQPGIVVIGLGCTPIGILLSLLLSAGLTLLANLFLRRRR